MAQLVVILIELWQQRYRIFIPAIILPLLALAYSAGNTQIYEATTTLNLNTNKAKSPMLRNVANSKNLEMLKRVLTSDQLIEDTLLETGDLLPSTPADKKIMKINNFISRVELTAVNDNIKINYQSTNPNSIERVLEVLSLNFIDEVLAPERFRVAQNLTALADQVKYYSEQEYLLREKFTEAKLKPYANENAEDKQKRIKNLVSLEFDMQRLQSQLNLSRAEYNNTLLESKIFIANITNRTPNSLLWFIESPVKITSERTTLQHIEYMLHGLVIAILLSVILIIMSHMNNNSLRKDEDIYDYLGLKILGRIPDMGDISLTDGQLKSNIKANF